MVFGQIIALVLFVVPVWIFSTFSTTPKDSSRATFTNIQINDSTVKTSAQSKPSKRNVDSRPVSNREFSGQFGVKFRIIPDSPNIPRPTVEVPKIYALDPTPFVMDEDISISDIDTGMYGAYVPEGADYEFELAGSDTSTLLTRGPKLISRVKPKIPPSAVMMGIGGVVDVLILIDPQGNHANFAVHTPDFDDTYPKFVLDVVLKDGGNATLEFYVDQQTNDLLYVTLKDDPEEFKFAKYLHEVLPQWRFSPAIKDGVPVYSFVYIHYNFCAPEDEDCIEFTFSSS